MVGCNYRTRQPIESACCSLAPQVGLEPTTLRLTAERSFVASRCKHNYLYARFEVCRRIWGDSGGTLGGLSRSLSQFEGLDRRWAPLEVCLPQQPPGAEVVAAITKSW